MVGYTDPPPLSGDAPPPYRSVDERSILEELTPLIPRPSKRQTIQATRNRKKQPWKRNLMIVGAAFLTSILILGLSIRLFTWVDPPVDNRPPIQVAIIGAGPAGLGALVGLGKELGRPRRGERMVNITIYDRKGRIGGRMALDYNTTAFSMPNLDLRIEDIAGGDVLPSIQMQERMNAFLGTQPAKQDTRISKEVGIIDVTSMTTHLTRPWRSGQSFWFFWRYGLSVWRARKLPTSPMQAMGRFTLMQGTFKSVASMSESADVASFVKKNAKDVVRDAGISDKYRDEIIAPQLQRQTGQELGEVSELAMALALEREDEAVTRIDSEKMSTFYQKILDNSISTLMLSTEVTDLQRDSVFGTNWKLNLLDTDQDQSYSSGADHVIIAAPFSQPFVQATGKDLINGDSVSFRSIHVTLLLVNGGFAPTFGGQGIDEVLFTSGSKTSSELDAVGVREISHVRNIYGPDPKNIQAEMVQSLFRILSSSPIPTAQLNAFFDTPNLSIIHEEEIENAYPLMWPRDDLKDLGAFEVEEGLWWTGAHEAVLSSVDASLAVGENVGRLVGREVREMMRRKY